MGSAITRVVVGEFLKGEKNPKIIGIGEASTEGIRHGYITNIDEAATSIRRAIDVAEKTSGVKIKRAYVSLSGTTLKTEVGMGVAVISKADGEVTNLDTGKALEECEGSLNLTNKKVVQVVPLSFRLDGKDVLGRIEGMHGSKLEMRALFVTYSRQHLEDLLAVLADAGIETIDVIPSGIAGSYMALTEKEKIVGGALVDIGAEKACITVFENGDLSSIHTFPIGGSDITNDIALGLKISLESAESLKLGNHSEDTSNKKLGEIIEARLSDIFEIIENHLKKIKRSELLPAGIIFIGGVANTKVLAELSRATLKLPSKTGNTEVFGNTRTKLRDPAWFVALGLILAAKNEEVGSDGSVFGVLLGLKKAIKSGLKQLMP